MKERPNSPENVLKRITHLKSDLSSEIVIQEERYHEEIDYPREIGSGHGMTTWDFSAGDSFIPRTRVVDQPRITEPDTDKRSSAREELLKIYEATPTFKVKWQSGRALGYSRIRILRDR